MAKKLKSVFTDDMEHCYFTGSPYCERHHIFYGIAYRPKSEKYGFIIPLAHHLHNLAKGSVHDNPNNGLDKYLKQMAQRYYEEHYGTREDFIREFGKNRL